MLTFKKLVRSLVIDNWEQKMRKETSPLDLSDFDMPEFMSLYRSHPIWWKIGVISYFQRIIDLQNTKKDS